MTDREDVPLEIVAKLRAVCLELPEAFEEAAWVGTRWRVRTRTFAHVLVIDSGWPPAYARAAACDGRITVMTFRSSGAELDALSNAGHPFFRPRWFPDIVGMVLDVECRLGLGGRGAHAELLRHGAEEVGQVGRPVEVTGNDSTHQPSSRERPRTVPLRSTDTGPSSLTTITVAVGSSWL